MSVKPFVIGLTGNIASGKSIVLQYLSNFGALTIDADLAAQETYLPGNPAYVPILERFGPGLTLNDGQINRTKLGRAVFGDPSALAELEAMIHPQVIQNVLASIAATSRRVVAVEGIKLIEVGLNKQCDRLWTVAADEETRLQRLMEARGMEEAAARQRLSAQAPQSEKIQIADDTIYTDGSFQQTYEQTWSLFSALGLSPCEAVSEDGEIRISRLTPDHFAEAACFMAPKTERAWEAEELYHLLGQRTVAAFYADGKLIQMMILRVEQRMAILLTQTPPRSELLPAKVSFSLLKRYFCGLADVLIAAKDFLQPEEAKILGFTYGDDEPPVHTTLYRNFLRKHGLMPGEVYFAKLGERLA